MFVNNSSQTINQSENSEKKLPVKASKILAAPLALSHYFIEWMGICYHHSLRDDAQLWYKILSPILFLSFLTAVLNLSDLLIMGDVTIGSVMYFVLTTGLFPEEKADLRKKWRQAINDITGKNVQKKPGASATSTPPPVNDEDIIIDAEFIIVEDKIKTAPQKTSPPTPKKRRNIYDIIAEELGETI